MPPETPSPPEKSHAWKDQVLYCLRKASFNTLRAALTPQAHTLGKRGFYFERGWVLNLYLLLKAMLFCLCVSVKGAPWQTNQNPKVISAWDITGTRALALGQAGTWVSSLTCSEHYHPGNCHWSALVSNIKGAGSPFELTIWITEDLSIDISHVSIHHSLENIFWEQVAPKWSRQISPNCVLSDLLAI